MGMIENAYNPQPAETEDYRPEAILDQASASKHGVFITFTTLRARNSFRTRLYKAIEKIRADWEENQNNWTDLLIRVPDSTEIKLWIGPPSAEGLGIVQVTEATEKCFD